MWSSPASSTTTRSATWNGSGPSLWRRTGIKRSKEREMMMLIFSFPPIFTSSFSFSFFASRLPALSDRRLYFSSSSSLIVLFYPSLHHLFNAGFLNPKTPPPHHHTSKGLLYWQVVPPFLLILPLCTPALKQQWRGQKQAIKGGDFEAQREVQYIRCIITSIQWC